MNDTKVKKQIVEKIKDSGNVLVALSRSPSVDAMSAALGLTLAINKINKHATAVFSGEIPPAIEFLEPEKTFESTVASLQDFIIALDKEKADHLRYKVDGDMVKIFITPYRTTIDEGDLEFSQGDYNVDLVIALGVDSEDDLDAALKTHGQIISDTTVVNISLGEPGTLGEISWNDKNASSYCEMATSLVKDIGDKDILDEQIATALLTGIVAETDRFSNDRTSSRVMTAAAELMGAGANQQLIAVQLEKAEEDDSEPERKTDEPEVEGEGPDLQDLPEDKREDKPKKDKVADDGSLTISHTYEGDVDQVAEQVAKDRQNDATKEAESKLQEHLDSVVPQAVAQEPLAPPTEAGAYEETPLKGAVPAGAWENKSGPALGGTLNATTEEAADAKRREAEDTKNRTILSHDSGKYLGGEPTYNNPISAVGNTDNAEPEVKDIFDAAPTEHSKPVTPPSPGVALQPLPTPEPATSTPEVTPNALPPLPSFEPSTAPPPVADPVLPTLPNMPPTPTLEEIDQANRAQVPSASDALNDVHAAFGTQLPGAATPAPAPQGGLPALPPMPPMPDFGSLPPLPGAPAPIMEPNPFGSTQPSVPSSPLGETLPPAPNMPEPGKADPGQFRIPGQ